MPFELGQEAPPGHLFEVHYHVFRSEGTQEHSTWGADRQETYGHLPTYEEMVQSVRDLTGCEEVDLDPHGIYAEGENDNYLGWDIEAKKGAEKFLGVVNISLKKVASRRKKKNRKHRSASSADAFLSRFVDHFLKSRTIIFISFLFCFLIRGPSEAFTLLALSFVLVLFFSTEKGDID